MDKHLAYAPLVRLRLERPHLMRNVVECFDEQVKPFAIKFDLRFAFVFFHAQITSVEPITQPPPPLPPPHHRQDIMRRSRVSGRGLSGHTVMSSASARRLRREDAPARSRRH